jgi:hypothetical protein
MWWPHPDAFDDLTVTDTEEGFELSAPDGSECGLWLGYFNRTEELHKEFETAFVQILREAVEARQINQPTEVTSNG